MTFSKKVSVLFDDIANNMLQSFEGWDKHIPSGGEMGGVRERRVRDFLAKYLPSKYGVASGHIFDKQGVTSLQEDIVIFDRFNCPVLEIDPYYQVFPCESVYATVEVKSKLDDRKIEECIEHTSQLRRLNRGDLGHIESFVFAYNSCESSRKPPAAWASDKFRERASSGTGQRPRPSIVLCLKHQFMLHFGLSEDDYIVDTLESGILLYYFEHLLSRISQVKTASPPLFTDYGWGENSIMRYYQGKFIPIKKLRVRRVLFSGTRDQALLHMHKPIQESKQEEGEEEE